VHESRRVESINECFKGHAFASWLAGNGQKKTFAQYLKTLGLVDEEIKITKNVKKAIVNRAHSIAERIMAMDKKKKKQYAGNI
jgi:hypothetical protein